jgi:ZF-HD class homeobox domain-containing protein
MGAHVLDGCGEFMPSPGDASAALLCAACGCHRSFHRREPVVVASPTPSPASAVVSPSAATPAAAANSRLMPLLFAPPHMQKRPPAPVPASPMSVPVPASPKSAPAALAESSSEELRPQPPPPLPPPPYVQPAVGGSASAPPAPGKKRFRTKFTPDQKERMLDFAHRIGWRIQKPDGGAVDAFCDQVGVPRRVLKVWMHNNKHLAKTPPTTPSQPLPAHHHHHHDSPPPPHHHHHHNPHPAQHNHHQQQHDP